MTPAQIIALGEARYGKPWLEKMAHAIGYSTSQLYRVVYDGSPVTRRMTRELEKLSKRKPKEGS